MNTVGYRLSHVGPLALAVLLAGCPAAPQAPVGDMPSASPGTPASPGTAEPTPSATAVTSPTPTLPTATLRGTVFDASGAAVAAGARVTVRSLNPTRPFETTVEVLGGEYVVNGVPIETQIAVTATRDGWTSRTRVEALRRNDVNFSSRNVVHFGGRYDENDPEGIAFFLSNHPEIESVEPRDDATSLSSERMTFKLVTSEPLDTVNQRRLAAAFMIVPNNNEAIADNATLPAETATNEASATAAELVGLRAGSNPATTSAYRYRQNAGYLNALVVSEFKWEADGRTATFTFDAPVKTDKADEAEYAFLLVQQGTDEIADGEGLQLGMNTNAEWGPIADGAVILNGIKETEVSLSRSETEDAEERWAATHVSYTTFSVAPDQTPPTLASVVARRNFVGSEGQASDRIELTFSEPMVAYPSISSSGLLSLNNYAIAAAATEEGLADRAIAPGTASAINSGAGAESARTAFGGSTGGVIGSNGSLMSGASGNFQIAVSPKDPKVVILTLPPGALPLDANAIKVFAGADSGAPGGGNQSVADPAGNALTENAKTGPIQ